MRNESGTGAGIRLGIAALLIVVAISVVSRGIIWYQRDRGGDQLIRLLDELGAEYAAPSGDGRSVSSWQKFLGTSSQPVTQVKIADVHLDAGLANHLLRNRAVKNIELLELKNITVADGTPLFLRNWRPVKQLVINTCSLPESWWTGLQDLRSLQELDLNQVRAPWMYGQCQFLDHLERIRFQGCNLTSLQLAAIQKSIRKTKIEVLAVSVTPDEIANYQQTVPGSD